MDLIKIVAAGKKGQCGTKWDVKRGGELDQIFISYDNNTVYSLHFLFYENGKLVSEKHGFDVNNVNIKSAFFDYPSEYLTSISGSFRLWYNGSTTTSILSSISFGTNKGCSYGPFGNTSTDDKQFNFQIGNHSSFAGFHGSKNGGCIESIGVYVKSRTTSPIHCKEEKDDDSDDDDDDDSDDDD